MKTKLFLLVLFCAAFSPTAYAQQNPGLRFDQKFYTSLALAALAPQGEFRENYTSLIGLGTRLNFYYRPSKRLPLLLGLDGGWARINKERLDIFRMENGFRHNYHVSAVGSVRSLGILLRVQPLDNRPVRAFVEGMTGYIFFQSRTKLWEEYDDSNTLLESILNKADRAFYGGLNTGFIFPINAASRAHILMSVAYLVGGKAQYGDQPRIDENLNASWDYKISKTSVLLTQIGFWVNIW